MDQSCPLSLQQCPFAGVACVLLLQLIASVMIYFLLDHPNPTLFLLSLAQAPSETEPFSFLLNLSFPQLRVVLLPLMSVVLIHTRHLASL